MTSSTRPRSRRLGGAVLLGKGFGIDRCECDGIARLEQEGRVAMQLIGRTAVCPSRCQPLGTGEALHPVCTPPIEIVPAGVKSRGFCRRGIWSDAASPDR
jgi:hypothetical protein